MSNINLQLVSTIATISAAIVVIFVRLRATKRPVTARKILIPPVGMSTGFFMFLYVPTHIPLPWGLAAFAIGAICFAYPLIRTSKFQRIDEEVYMQRSKAFVFILLGILMVRLILHDYVERYISITQTGAVFFILAFGMLLPWRIAMYFRYRRFLREEIN